MYSKNLKNELMLLVDKFIERWNNTTVVSYDLEKQREMVSRYEELVPELREYHVEFNEANIMKIVSMFSYMIQYFDPAPAANTRVIKKYVSEEKMAEYAMILKGNLEEIKVSLEKVRPGIIDKLKAKFKLNDDVQTKFKFGVIVEAQKKCMRNGKISMAKAIRDFLKRHNGDSAFDLEEEDKEKLKKFMSYVNKAFEWICLHERAILKEIIFYMSKEKLLEDTIRKKYSDVEKIPDNPTMDDIFMAALKAVSVGSKYKFTKAYDEYLEGEVKDMILAFGVTDTEESTDSTEDKQ